MKSILIVEPDKVYLRRMLELLKDSKEELDIHPFISAKAFMGWLTQRAKKWYREQHEEPKKEAESPLDIALIILDNRVLKGKDHSLLQIIYNKITQCNFTNQESPCRFLITAYENSKFSRKDFVHPLIFNVLFKPTDPLLLTESLSIALKGYGPITTSLYTHEANEEVEILKDITVHSITELGFRTLSKREIPIGKKARYYSPVFEDDNTNYIFAFCYKNSPYQSYVGYYESSFSFFGISSEQLASIRRHIRTAEQCHFMAFPHDNTELNSVTKKVLLVSTDMELTNSLFTTLGDRFDQLELTTIPSVFYLHDNFKADLSLSEDEDDMGFLPTEDDYSIVFNKDRDQIIKIVGPNEDLTESDIFLRQPVSAIKTTKSFFQDLFPPHDLRVVTRTLNERKLEKSTVIKVVDQNENFSFLRLQTFHKTFESDGKGSWTLTLNELSASERADQIKVDGLNIKEVDAIFINLTQVSPRAIPKLKTFSEKMREMGNSTRFFGLSSQALKSYTDLAKYEFLDDYLILPIDHFYINRKMKQLFPHWPLNTEEEFGREGVELETGIQTALPVQISKISETHVALNYTRALKIGEIRRFVLFMEGEAHLPEIWGRCNHVEKLSETEYRNEFVFFGVMDKHLKYVRKWVRALYIKAKQGG